jgi:hypothetical protein
VPEAADEHGGHQGEVGAHVSVAAAAEGDVEIVAEPGGERDAPAAPEVGEADGRVGKAEIIRESKPQAQGGTDGGDGESLISPSSTIRCCFSKTSMSSRVRLSLASVH